MNVLLTQVCNRRCSFCFARERLGGSPFMSRENLRKVLGFLERSGDRELRLLGGEPTLHPEFRGIVEEALARGFHVHLFTNAMMRAETVDFLAGLPAGAVSLLCNVSPQAEDSPRLKERVRHALERLGPRCQVGITLTAPGEEFSFVADLVDRHRLQRKVRLGIAHPVVGRGNACLEPAAYRGIGRHILALAEGFHRRGITLGFDCGITLCMFEEAEIGRLFMVSEGLKMVCRPILDVGPDLDVWNCFPLSGVLVDHLDRFRNRTEMAAFYERLLRPYRSLGCMPECLECRFLRAGQCTGGCVAHAMTSLRPPPAAKAPRVRPPDPLRTGAPDL
jgi:MoaA/NifB/PqqE/SkfB family radical SAM enzyme